ncbi:hypothetical protein TIFTF001_003914 [Ficus carica]|uniref:Uncharacterized protein n=1 Tax=Ficus carica TaxID=3494 RepID=A0AA88A2A4_FICCA|nr:hypothetical protein TIFTF001_003914 [Ficus carica]
MPTSRLIGSPNVICEDSSSESFVRDNPVYNPVSDFSASHGSGSEVEMRKDFQPVPNLILPSIGTPWNDLKTMYDTMENDFELKALLKKLKNLKFYVKMIND